MKDSGYVATRCVYEEKPCLLIYHEKLYNHLPLGVTSRVRMSVTEYQYVMHVMMREVERGDMEKSNAVSKLHESLPQIHRIINSVLG